MSTKKTESTMKTAGVKNTAVITHGSSFVFEYCCAIIPSHRKTWIMKKILLPVLMLIIAVMSLVSCDSSGEEKKLLLIDVTSSKVVFEEGDSIKDFITVKSFYSDGSEKTLSKESYSTNLAGDKVAADTSSVTVSYTEDGITKSNTIQILVKHDSKILLFIDVSLSPVDYVFSEGDVVKDHLIVNGYYSDGSEETVTDYSTDIETVTSTTDKVTVTYETKTKTIPVSVSEALGTLESIKVLQLPAKTTYEEETAFDARGLVVVGIYGGDKVKTITDYTLSIPDGQTVGTVGGTDLSATKTNTVSYEGKTTSFEITVILPTLESIRIASAPTTLVYKEAEKFDKSGLKVVAVYSNNTEKEVSDYTLSISDGSFFRPGTVSSGDYATLTNTVSWNGKTASFDVKVEKTLCYTMKKGTEWLPSTIVKGNIKKIVFDYTDNMRQDVKEYLNRVSIGNTDDDLIYLVSGSGVELHIFSDGLICGNSDCLEMFAGFTALESIYFNNFNTSYVADMRSMFSGCVSLEALDISDFDMTLTTERPLIATPAMFNDVPTEIVIIVNDLSYWNSLFPEHTFGRK